jgi:ATP-dependent helicase HrpA
LRLEKYSVDPARDASRKTELRPQDPRYWHLLAERKGAVDDRMQEFRWLLEEMRVSFFALELRPPPKRVSVERLDNGWSQLSSQGQSGPGCKGLPSL